MVRAHRDRVAVALRALLPASRALADRWRRVAGGRSGVATCFLWAVGEATVWPVIPDVALFLLVLAAPRRAPWLLVATVAGATVGGTITVFASSVAPDAAMNAVLHMPLVHVRSVATVEAYLRDHSLVEAFFYQPWSGLPFKLWAVLAVSGGHQPLSVVPVFVAGRTLRFAAATGLAALFGRLVERRLPDIALPLLFVCGPSAAYLFYVVAVAG